MIKSYANKLTEKIANGEQPRRIAVGLLIKTQMRLVQIDNATVLDDLRLPASNRLEKLSGDRQGQYSIRVNQQWRICFKFRSGHAYDVALVDYH